LTRPLSTKSAASVSAALRHVRDAEALLAGSVGVAPSPDQAYHLAGFGPECARKATLSQRWADPAIGHRFDDERALDLLIALDPHAHRYRPLRWNVRYPELSAWNPNCRYDKTGTTTLGRATSFIRQARDAVTEVVRDLWTDGRLESEALR